MKNNKLTTVFFSLLLMLLLTSCGVNSEYEAITDIKEHVWHADSTLNFDFEIKENGVYDVFFLVKNKTSYRYYNLYFKTIFKSETELITDKLQEVILFHPKTGEPYGKGLSGVMEHQFLAFPTQNLKKGKYTIALQQYMRVNELKDVMAVGIKIQKSPNSPA